MTAGAAKKQPSHWQGVSTQPEGRTHQGGSRGRGVDVYHAAVVYIEPLRKFGRCFHPPRDLMSFQSIHVVVRMVDDLLRDALANGGPALARLDGHCNRIQVGDVLSVRR